VSLAATKEQLQSYVLNVANDLGLNNITMELDALMGELPWLQ
jgi:hypothetical protein